MYEVDRTRRVAEAIKRELAALITREVNDPRLRGVSINSVTVSRDLKYATIYVSSLRQTESSSTGKTDPAVNSTQGKPGAQPGVEQLLNNASGYLRRLLSQNSNLRVTPSLRFKYDDSIQRGVEMSSLIDSLVNKTEGSKDGS